ncbi:MAG TPA: DNA polymerase III subunit gamma/tau, partial [Stellaceae bacterium]|nr:DNA polymerase III subunit gamma/tau [Stellaceae bacterium]
VSQAEGAATLEQQEAAARSAREGEAARHPLVRAVLDAFPGATIAAVRERLAAPGPPAGADAAGDDDGDDDSDDDGAGSEEDER